MKTTIKLTLISLTLFALFTTGCKEKGCTDPFAVNFDIEAEKDDESCIYPELTLHLHQMVGDQELTIDQEYTVNGTKISFSLFQYYLSGFQIMDMDGTGYGIDDVYLLGKTDKMHYPVGTIRGGHAHMLRFNVGIDAATNAQSEADFAAWDADHPLAAQTPSMHWNWNLGYIFFKVEGKVDSNGDGVLNQNFIFHVGTDNMLRETTVMVHKDIASADEAIHLKVDLAKVVENIDFSIDTNWDTHTGNNPELAKKLADNLAGAFSKN